MLVFQSTHPVGCDDTLLCLCGVWASFNPRIPWDATLSPALRRRATCVSIHASRGMRQKTVNGSTFVSMFQSTHPVGCDLRSPVLTRLLSSFNPRIPWDATPAGAGAESAVRVSIHASRGMRQWYSNSLIIVVMFQSTHPVGCDSRVGL